MSKQNSEEASSEPIKLSSENINRILEENSLLIGAAKELQNSSRPSEELPFLKLIQKNLLFLASTADCQPRIPPQQTSTAQQQQNSSAEQQRK